MEFGGRVLYCSLDRLFQGIVVVQEQLDRLAAPQVKQKWELLFLGWRMMSCTFGREGVCYEEESCLQRSLVIFSFVGVLGPSQ